jgi:hypothetical protein
MLRCNNESRLTSNNDVSMHIKDISENPLDEKQIMLAGSENKEYRKLHNKGDNSEGRYMNLRGNQGKEVNKK